LSSDCIDDNGSFGGDGCDNYDDDDSGTKLTEYKVDEEAVSSIAMEVGVAKREAEIVSRVIRPNCNIVKYSATCYYSFMEKLNF